MKKVTKQLSLFDVLEMRRTEINLVGKKSTHPAVAAKKDIKAANEKILREEHALTPEQLESLYASDKEESWWKK